LTDHLQGVCEEAEALLELVSGEVDRYSKKDHGSLFYCIYGKISRARWVNVIVRAFRSASLAQKHLPIEHGRQSLSKMLMLLCWRSASLRWHKNINIFA